jgi:hypothetical protein
MIEQTNGEKETALTNGKGHSFGSRAEDTIAIAAPRHLVYLLSQYISVPSSGLPTSLSSSSALFIHKQSP